MDGDLRLPDGVELVSQPPGRPVNPKPSVLTDRVVLAVAVEPWAVAFNALAGARTPGIAVPIHLAITER